MTWNGSRVKPSCDTEALEHGVYPCCNISSFSVMAVSRQQTHSIYHTSFNPLATHLPIPHNFYLKNNNFLSLLSSFLSFSLIPHLLPLTASRCTHRGGVPHGTACPPQCFHSHISSTPHALKNKIYKDVFSISNGNKYKLLNEISLDITSFVVNPQRWNL